jgi:hypothetical protein
MSKNSLVVAVKPHKKMGWCVFLNREPYAVGSYAYCNEVASGLMLRYLQHGPASMPAHVASKGGAA